MAELDSKRLIKLQLYELGRIHGREDFGRVLRGLQYKERAPVPYYMAGYCDEVKALTKAAEET